MLTTFTNGKYENSWVFVQDLPLVLTPVVKIKNEFFDSFLFCTLIIVLLE